MGTESVLGTGIVLGVQITLCIQHALGVEQIDRINHLIYFRIHEMDIAGVKDKGGKRQQEKSAGQHEPEVFFQQLGKSLPHHESLLPVYWIKISSRVGSWEWMLTISSYAKGNPFFSSGAVIVASLRLP